MEKNFYLFLPKITTYGRKWYFSAHNPNQAGHGGRTERHADATKYTYRDAVAQVSFLNGSGVNSGFRGPIIMCNGHEIPTNQRRIV